MWGGLRFNYRFEWLLVIKARLVVGLFVVGDEVGQGFDGGRGSIQRA
jgi:hypothetical protein